jgi:2-methylcitrate dehydratase
VNLRSRPAAPAERLAACRTRRYEDLDSATIERVKTHFIDTIGCGRRVRRRPCICREVALGAAGGAAPWIGTRRAPRPISPLCQRRAFRYTT